MAFFTLMLSSHWTSTLGPYWSILPLRCPRAIWVVQEDKEMLESLDMFFSLMAMLAEMSSTTPCLNLRLMKPGCSTTAVTLGLWGWWFW